MKRSKREPSLPTIRPSGLFDDKNEIPKKTFASLSKAEKDELDARFQVSKDMTTCFACDSNKTCPYAWDPYNTDGDCLAK